MKLSNWMSLLCFAIALVILWQFRQIILLVFAAVVIATALNSLVRRLMHRLGLPRKQAVWATLGLVMLGGLLVLGLVLPLFIFQVQQLLELIPNGFERLVSEFNRFIQTPPTWVPQDLTMQPLPNFSTILQQAGSLGSTVFGNFLTFFSSSLAILLQFLLVVILALMLLSDPIAYRQVIIRLFPSWYRRRADDIFSKCEQALLQWLGAVSVSSLFVATCSFVGLMFLGIKYAFAHAVLAGLFNFIPNLGPTLSSVFPTIVGFLDSPLKALLVVILYLVIQNVESYWFSPMIMQERVSLLPAATLVAQLFFATFLGPIGLVLALPLAVVSKTWIQEAWVQDVLDCHPPPAGAMARAHLAATTIVDIPTAPDLPQGGDSGSPPA